MLEANVHKLLDLIGPDEVVLDVGGWACPFNRADWILDSGSYATRGFYATIGLPASQGGREEHFEESTWVQRDICDRGPWPFEDGFFDFSICSHTLEDVRDPLFVCSELIRVSNRGYIEVPSRVFESSRGMESPRIAGLSHHRWLVEIEDHHLQFTMKYHMIHGDPALSFPRKFGRKLTPEEKVSCLFWEDHFTFGETTLHGTQALYDELKRYVEQRYRHPPHLRALRGAGRLTLRLVNGAKRRLTRSRVRSGER